LVEGNAARFVVKAAKPWAAATGYCNADANCPGTTPQNVAEKRRV
jgi:hypothetical protein